MSRRKGDASNLTLVVGRIRFSAGVGLRNVFPVTVAAGVLSSKRPQGASGETQAQPLGAAEPTEQTANNSSRMGAAVCVRGPVIVAVSPQWTCAFLLSSDELMDGVRWGQDRWGGCQGLFPGATIWG